MSIDTIKTIAVLGSGTMGNGIAHVFARAGYKVILRDVEQRFSIAALDTIAKNLDREIKKGKIAEARTEASSLASSPSPTSPISPTPTSSSKPSPKRSKSSAHVLTEADRLLRDDVIIASNTSSIAMTTLAALTKRPDRFVGMHFMNPVPRDGPRRSYPRPPNQRRHLRNHNATSPKSSAKNQSPSTTPPASSPTASSCPLLMKPPTASWKGSPPPKRSTSHEDSA